MSRVAWLGSLVLVLSCFACGDDEPGQGSGDAGTNDPDGSFTSCVTCGAYGKVLGALCDLHARCPDALYPIAYRDRRECMEIFGFFLTCRLEDVEIDDVDYYSLRQSIPNVDEGKADACVAWLASAECSTLNGALDDDDDSGSGDGERPSNPCEGLIVAAEADESDDSYYRGLGESCEDRSCQDALYCTEPSVSAEGVVTCEVCAAKPAVDMPCALYGICAEGLYCEYLPGEETRFCRAMFAGGVACEGDHQCLSGYCHPDTRVCFEDGFLGDSCGADTDCRDRFCDDGVCAQKRAPGVACAAPVQCQNAICEAGRCGKVDGSPCTFEFDCAGRCDLTQSLCVAASPQGTSCQNDDECATGYCDTWGRTCQYRCYAHDECGDGEYCNFSQSYCQPVIEDGFGCRDDESCRSGICNASEVCGPPPEIGADCSQSYECYPLGFCDGGKCAQRKGPGQACSALDSCLEPMLCDGGKCKMINLECRPAPIGKQCAFLRVCADNAYCDIFEGFVCKARKAAGQDCFRTTDCADGLRCALKADQSGLACTARVGAGEACQEGGDCVDGLFCVDGASGERICQSGPAGQPCSEYEDEGAPCPDGFFCGDDDVCQAVGGEGADCYYEQPCLPGFYCDTSTCRAKKPAGESCRTGDDDCADGLWCSNDYVCATFAAPEAECQTYPEGHCGPGFVCTWIDEESLARCRPGAALGESCYEDDQCASGHCHDSLGCVAAAQCVLP